MELRDDQYNISEQDLEEYLYQNPDVCGVNRWLARQLKLPSGVADLVGYIEEFSQIIVFELKKDNPRSEHLAQVCRYAHDIDQIVPRECFVTKTLICKNSPTIEGSLLFEAEAMGVELMTYSADVTIRVGGGWHWTDEAVDKQLNLLREVRQSPPFSELHEGFGKETNKVNEEENEK